MRLTFMLCKYLSYLFASLHHRLINVRFCKCPAFIQNAIDNRFEVLRSVWYARIVRRVISFLIRTPAKENILKLITVKISIPEGQGCIIAMCRTPWRRLLVQWCLNENFGLVITGIPYHDHDKRRRIHRKGRGVTELRELIWHLRTGGRIIAIVDIFNNLNNCPINFMGSQQNISLFVERLANLANVPILVNIPRLSNRSFDFIYGPNFLSNGITPKEGILTRRIISFLETEIRTNPAIWAKYVK